MLSASWHSALRTGILKTSGLRSDCPNGYISCRKLLQARQRNLPLDRKRLTNLSITHKLCSDHETEFDVSEAGYASPHHHVAWRRIAGSC